MREEARYLDLLGGFGVAGSLKLVWKEALRLLTGAVTKEALKKLPNLARLPTLRASVVAMGAQAKVVFEQIRSVELTGKNPKEILEFVDDVIEKFEHITDYLELVDRSPKDAFLPRDVKVASVKQELLIMRSDAKNTIKDLKNRLKVFKNKAILEKQDSLDQIHNRIINLTFSKHD